MSFRLKSLYFERDGPVYTRSASSFCRNPLTRPKSITILYCDFTLFIDIFHFKVLFLCCFGLFYTVYNFPVPKQQNQDSAVEKWIPSCSIRSSPKAMKFYGENFYV